MRTITIKGNLGRYDDVSPFLVESGALELKIELPDMAWESFIVTELNGKTRKVPIPQNGIVMFDNLLAGELRAEIKHYLHGNLIKTFKVEPLILKEVDGVLSAMPAIAAMERDIAALKRKADEFEQALEMEKTARTRAENALCAALLAYAFADYKTNFRLNMESLSLEEFAAALGVSLKSFTEEAIDKIKNMSEVL